MLQGIPQQGLSLGRPNAPVTLVEYGDLQCPICRAYTVATLPTLVRDYVRTGKVRLEFRGLAFLGADSETALKAVIAAGAQNKGWNMLDLLYRNQGEENSGWATESTLRAAAAAIPGLYGRAVARRSSGAGDAERDPGDAGTGREPDGLADPDADIRGRADRRIASVSADLESRRGRIHAGVDQLLAR